MGCSSQHQHRWSDVEPLLPRPIALQMSRRRNNAHACGRVVLLHSQPVARREVVVGSMHALLSRLLVAWDGSWPPDVLSSPSSLLPLCVRPCTVRSLLSRPLSDSAVQGSFAIGPTEGSFVPHLHCFSEGRQSICCTSKRMMGRGMREKEKARRRADDVGGIGWETRGEVREKRKA